MNKSDMLKDAQKLDDMGMDPDHVMLNSVEEYAAAHGEEVDTYDEEKRALSQENDLLLEIECLEREIIDLRNEKDLLFAFYSLTTYLATFNQKIMKLDEKILECEKAAEDLEKLGRWMDAREELNEAIGNRMKKNELLSDKGNAEKQLKKITNILQKRYSDQKSNSQNFDIKGYMR